MSQLLIRKWSTLSLNKHESDISDVSLREEKISAVKSKHYQKTLEFISIYMSQSEPHLWVIKADKAFCQELLNKEQLVLKDSLFNENLFESTCEDIANWNETRVIQNIDQLIVSASEDLAQCGATHLKHLIENVNEDWIKFIFLVKDSHSQPDFFMDLKLTAFTADQLKKLNSYIDDWQTTSHLVHTDKMYFLFLISEMKCSNEALNIADQQNTHSTSVAVNTVVKLYWAIFLQDELHQEILVFSVSHDHWTVRIYSHYALINRNETFFYCHSIWNFNITDQDSKDEWTVYKFTRNIYNIFVSIHLKRIHIAVDQLPNLDVFLVQPLSQQSNAQSLKQNNSQSTLFYSQESLLRLPSSQMTEPVFKKSKGKDTR